MQMTEIQLSLSKCKWCFSPWHFLSTQVRVHHPEPEPEPNRDRRQPEHPQGEESPSKTLKRKATRDGSETLRQELVWEGSMTPTKLEVPGYLGSLLGSGEAAWCPPLSLA